MDPIQAGYRAFNGYIFSAAQAEAYNRAAARARQNPTEENLNGAHHVFSCIISTPESARAALADATQHYRQTAKEA